MASTQLYNEGGAAIYPKAESEGVLYNNTNVKITLDNLIAQVNRIDNTQSGADQIQGDLDVKITYLRTETETAPGEDDAWQNDMILPNDKYPYLWKKTVFLWKERVVLTKIELVTTSLYPQTQYMYTSHKSSNGSLGGPTDYEDGSADKYDKDHLWYTTPQEVTSSQPQAYMSIRTRKPGEDWSSWSTPAMYGSYAFDSIPDIRYYACSSLTCDSDPNQICDETTGQLAENKWKKSITSYTSGTWYLFQTHGVRVDTQYQKEYGQHFWEEPTLISIITIP